MNADDDVQLSQVRSRQERDAEGFANAIVLSSDEEDDAPRQALGAAGKRPVGAVAAAGAGSSHDAATDGKPDIKRLKQAAAPSPP
eukprot:3592387-Prymnesium_polylepis.1